MEGAGEEGGEGVLAGEGEGGGGGEGGGEDPSRILTKSHSRSFTLIVVVFQVNRHR